MTDIFQIWLIFIYRLQSFIFLDQERFLMVVFARFVRMNLFVDCALIQLLTASLNIWIRPILRIIYLVEGWNCLVQVRRPCLRPHQFFLFLKHFLFYLFLSDNVFAELGYQLFDAAEFGLLLLWSGYWYVPGNSDLVVYLVNFIFIQILLNFR